MEHLKESIKIGGRGTCKLHVGFVIGGILNPRVQFKTGDDERIMANYKVICRHLVVPAQKKIISPL